MRTILPAGFVTVMMLSTGLAAAEPSGGEAAREQSLDYARRGAYLGVGVVGAFEQFDLGAAADQSDFIGYGFRAGYRLHPNVAAEMSFERYTEADLDVLGTSVLDIDGWSITANAKGYPLTGRFQPYGLLGLGALYLNAEDQLGLGFSDDQAAFALRFGGGVDAYVTKNIVLNVEASYLLPTGDLDDFPLVPVSGSIQYRF